jgi:hypothetical protein
MTVKMLSRSVHNEHELALRPKPINIKWSNHPHGNIYTLDRSRTRFNDKNWQKSDGRFFLRSFLILILFTLQNLDFNFKGIIDNISATNEKICSGFGHDESGIASDINEIATNCSTNIRNSDSIFILEAIHRVFCISNFQMLCATQILHSSYFQERKHQRHILDINEHSCKTCPNKVTAKQILKLCFIY